MSTFKTALQICGLSQKEAAALFDVRLDTVKSWSGNRNKPPQGVWDMLANLYADIEYAAEHGSHVLETDGLNSKELDNLSIDIPEVDLPCEGSKQIAGVISLLITLNLK